MQTVGEILRTVVAVLFIVGIGVGAVRIIRSGFLLLTAGSNARQIDHAKDILWRAVLGVAIMITTWVFIPR